MTNDHCRSQNPTCVYSRYRSRLDHLLVTRPRNSQQTIRGTVIRSNRGGTSTATENKRKTRHKKVFTPQTTLAITTFTFSWIILGGS